MTRVLPWAGAWTDDILKFLSDLFLHSIADENVVAVIGMEIDVSSKILP